MKPTLRLFIWLLFFCLPDVSMGDPLTVNTFDLAHQNAHFRHYDGGRDEQSLEVLPNLPHAEQMTSEEYLQRVESRQRESAQAKLED